MQIPRQCKRSKGMFVSDDFKDAVRDACNWKKAEKLPLNSFYDLYVDTDLLRRMEAADNQIIWGRRGTGKTHLLKAFVQKINTDNDAMKMAFYISCDSINIESPVDIRFSDDTDRMKYYGRETFRYFLLDIVEQLIETYKDQLSAKKSFNSKYSIIQRNEIYRETDNALMELYENCAYGIPIVSEKERIEVVSDHEEDKGSSVAEVSGKGKFALSLSLSTFIKRHFCKAKQSDDSGSEDSNSLSVEGELKHQSSKDTNVSTSNDYKTTSKYVVRFTHTHSLLEKLVKALHIEQLYICIDELWLIDRKRELSIQPIFLDYLRQSCLNVHGISVKIASIREVTRLNSKTSAQNSFGVQSGHDIMEIINLDMQFREEKERLQHYKNILYSRINYFFNKRSNKHHSEQKRSEYNIDFIIESLFKTSTNLSTLIRVTHNIPRNFLTILERCLTYIGYDLEHYFVHQYIITEVVIKTYLEDKRSNLPMNDGSLFSVINEYINSKRAYFFLVSSEQVKRLKVEIDNLVYVEIIHQVPSAILPINLMDKYKGFYIDAGKYLHALRSSGIEDSGTYNFSYVLPNSVREEYQKYVLDLDLVNSEYIECTNCGGRVGKNHPVFKKTGLCPICAFELITNQAAQGQDVDEQNLHEQVASDQANDSIEVSESM